MRSIVDMLRAERSARLFFLSHAQSTFGNGLGYVALILVAYDRFTSPWGITLILLADFLPSTIFGVLLGAASDRWPRRTCACVADLLRAVAFVGIALVGGFGPTVALALVAGLGTGLFNTAVVAALPTLVAEERAAPATSLYGMLTEIGVLAGSSCAALLLLAFDPETLLIINGVSFAISAVIVVTLPFAPPTEPEAGAPRSGLLADSIAGVRAARSIPGVLTVLLAGAGALLCTGVLSVVELLYATDELHAGKTGFSLFVGLLGAGIIVGNAWGARGGPPETLRRYYLAGLALMGLALLGMSVAPNFGIASSLFVLCGVGNGFVIVYGRLLIQHSVPESLSGRVWGLWVALSSAAFGVAFTVAGGLTDALGVRTVLAIGGIGCVIVWLVTIPLLTRIPRSEPVGAVAAGER